MEQAFVTQPDPGYTARPTRLELRLQSIGWLAEGIVGLELAAPDGADLPPYRPGAHLDLHLPGGLIRQYSLYGDPLDRQRYRVAVLREPRGRGGSEAVHTQLRVGQTLPVSPPRQHFELESRAQRHLFFAGGIGITPILAMLRAVHRQGQPFHLYYCTRQPGRTAFLDELQPLVREGLVTLHHDEGDARRSLDLAALLREPQAGTHLYACGPGGFLEAFERAAAHWPAGSRHLERFGAGPVPAIAATAAPEQTFEVQMVRSGCQALVPPGKSIVEVLHDQGVEVDVSCREGYCGTCMTRYLGGEPVHRDSVLDEDDRREFVMVCCARADPSGGPLMLDL